MGTPTSPHDWITCPTCHGTQTVWVSDSPTNTRGGSSRSSSGDSAPQFTSLVAVFSAMFTGIIVGSERELGCGFLLGFIAVFAHMFGSIGMLTTESENAWRYLRIPTLILWLGLPVIYAYFTSS